MDPLFSNTLDTETWSQRVYNEVKLRLSGIYDRKDDVFDVLVGIDKYCVRDSEISRVDSVGMARHLEDQKD